jgi:hypothetical protein
LDYFLKHNSLTNFLSQLATDIKDGRYLIRSRISAGELYDDTGSTRVFVFPSNFLDKQTVSNAPLIQFFSLTRADHQWTVSNVPNGHQITPANGTQGRYLQAAVVGQQPFVSASPNSVRILAGAGGWYLCVTSQIDASPHLILLTQHRHGYG